MLKQRTLFLTVGIAIGSLSLLGCSSSGGGSDISQRQHAPGGSLSRPSPVPLEPGLVRVAVADSSFDVATITNAERVIDSLEPV